MRFLTTLLLLSLVASAATASDLPYDGQTITIATSTPEVAQLLKNRAIDFRNETGANVVVILRDYSSFFQDVLTDLEQGSPFFDVYATILLIY
jgi:ABC-type glycerol-3-phosphate transport system substrate-binding protein